MLGPINFKDKTRPEALKTKKEDRISQRNSSAGAVGAIFPPRPPLGPAVPPERAGAAEGSLVGAPLASQSQGEGLLSERKTRSSNTPGKWRQQREVGKTIPHDRWSY